MPSSYRGISDDCNIWRIDVENESRPSKRRRTSVTEIFEKYGIDCNDRGSIANREVSSTSYSSMEEDTDAYVYSKPSSYTMIVDNKNNESIGSILKCYIRFHNELEILQEGLEKLMDLVGANNEDAVSRQHHIMELLNFGGHWMITNLFSTLIPADDGDNTAAMDAMDDESENVFHSSDKDDDEGVIAVVARSCEVLRELLTLNQSKTYGKESFSKSVCDKDSTIRYQIYCAGGLDAVVSALKQFPSSYDVQLAGCQVLSCLASFKGWNDDKNEHRGFHSSPIDRRSRCNSTLTPIISNLYHSTNRLNIVIRLLDSGAGNDIQMGKNRNTWCLSNTQKWQLYYVVSDIIVGVVRQLPVDSIYRQEIIQMIQKYFSISDDARSCNSTTDTIAMDECEGTGYQSNGDGFCSREGKGYHNRNKGRSKAIRHVSGITRHMYEHLMMILTREKDGVNTDAAFLMNH